MMTMMVCLGLTPFIIELLRWLAVAVEASRRAWLEAIFPHTTTILNHPVCHSVERAPIDLRFRIPTVKAPLRFIIANARLEEE